jgi:cell division protein FtsQ
VSTSHRTRRISRVVALLLILLLSVGAYLLGWSSVFTVKGITVVGAANPADTNRLETLSHITLGEKLARIEPRAVSVTLREIAWVDHSQVRRDWFHGVVLIRVWPRTPVARFQGQLLDGGGGVFILPNYSAASLPFISANDHLSALFALLILTQLPPVIRLQLLGISVVGLNSATLSIKERSRVDGKVLQVAWGDSSNMTLKVKVYQALIALPENAGISEIDLSAPHAPIVK